MLTLQIPDVDPQDSALTAEIRREVALLMYQHEMWSLGQAARYAGMPYVLFQQLLGERKIPMNYDVEDFLADVDTLSRMK